MEITDSRIEKLSVPCEPGISDSAGTFETAGVTYLELETNEGHRGVGLGWTDPEESLSEFRRRFEPVADHLPGESPFHLRNQLRLPGGGAYPGEFRRAVDVALWDLCGKHLDVPVYELMGGTDPVVPGYASGLAFEYDDETARDVYGEFAQLGFDAAKVKVGYPTVEADIDRLRLVRDVLGEDALLAVDVNCTWTPKETTRRARAYREAGLDVYWIEDPVPDENRAGIKRVVDGVPRSLVNVGEYAGFDGKRQLLADDAVDMLNLRTGLLSESLNAAAMGASHGAKLHVGDMQAEIGVHLAAALPGKPYLEYWKRPWDRITERSVPVEDGTLVAPDRPGHGVTVSEDAVAEYGESE
ncbi:MAG: mandelate racemase/muconate lactonizing enzyme family protein [Haloarculaceae archaeon]